MDESWALEENRRHVSTKESRPKSPDVFDSIWEEVAVVSAILMSLTMADFSISGFQVLLPALVEPLQIPEESYTWPSSVLTLVAGSFLLPMGRVSDMYGGYTVFIAGMAWFVLWTALIGCAKNLHMLVICRAMEGLGAAACLPAGICILGNIYGPGRRKNLVFSLYGAICPIGFWLGLLLGGMAYTLLSWRWYFWIGAAAAGASSAAALAAAPRSFKRNKGKMIEKGWPERVAVITSLKSLGFAGKKGWDNNMGRWGSLWRILAALKKFIKVKDVIEHKSTMDWWGAFTMVPGMMLLVYAITDSSRASHGWTSPHIIACLAASTVVLAIAVYVEGWVAESPLLPPDIFRIKYMKRVLLTLFLTWGAFSIFLFYGCFYIEKVIGEDPFDTAIWFSPWAAGGLVLATISGLILHIIPGRTLLLISGGSRVAALMIFALLPSCPTYWAWILPAMLAETACVDVLWTVINVFLTTSLPPRHQGLAGAMINVSLYLGGAFFLAVAEVALEMYKKLGWDLKSQYKGVFWLGVGIATVAWLICAFIRLGRATGPLTESAEEDRQMPTPCKKTTGGTPAPQEDPEKPVLLDAILDKPTTRAEASQKPSPHEETSRKRFVACITCITRTVRRTAWAISAVPLPSLFKTARNNGGGPGVSGGLRAN